MKQCTASSRQQQYKGGGIGRGNFSFFRLVPKSHPEIVWVMWVGG